jgi:hypothetical protein
MLVPVSGLRMARGYAVNVDEYRSTVQHYIYFVYDVQV